MTYSPQGLGDALGVGPVAKRWNNNFNCQSCHISSQTEAALHFFLQNVRLSWTFPSLSSLLPMLHAVLRSRDGPWCRQLPPNPGSAALPYLAKVVAHAHKQ